MSALKVGFIVVGIIAGLYALFVVSPNTEVALGFFALTFGLLAIFWTMNAYKDLSPNSSLRVYTALFMLSLVFILADSVWRTLSVLFGFVGNLRYVGYFLTSAAYVVFVAAAYNILNISKEFGFRSQAESISRSLNKPLSRRSKK